MNALLTLPLCLLCGLLRRRRLLCGCERMSVSVLWATVAVLPIKDMCVTSHQARGLGSHRRELLFRPFFTMGGFLRVEDSVIQF